VYPTAAQKVGLGHETSSRYAPGPAGVGDGTTDHVEPFHWRTRVSSTPPTVALPTPIHHVAVWQVTLLK